MEPTVPTTKQKLEPGVFQGAPEQQKPKFTPVSSPRPIRTMKNDAEEIALVQKETAISIALAEEKKHERERADTLALQKEQPAITVVAPKKRARIFVIIGLFLIIAILVLAYIFVLPRIKNIDLPTIKLPSFTSNSGTPVEPATPGVSPLALSLIPSQSEKRFAINTDTLEQVASAISSEQNQAGISGSIKNLYFTKDTTVNISSSELLQFIKVQPPNIIERSLGAPFMVGLFTDDAGRATPFYVFKISAYDNGIAGMLEWEPVLMDLFGALFTNATSGTATNAKFYDITILGKDSRTIDNQSMSIAYTFADPNTIIIAGSRTALENLLRLATTR